MRTCARRGYESALLAEFVNAIRECLGLQDLYPSEEKDILGMPILPWKAWIEHGRDGLRDV